MVLEQVDVAVGQFLAIHLLDLVAQEAAVEADESLLGQFADEGGDVLVLHVGVGVIFEPVAGLVELQ